MSRIPADLNNRNDYTCKKKVSTITTVPNKNSVQRSKANTKNYSSNVLVTNDGNLHPQTNNQYVRTFSRSSYHACTQAKNNYIKSYNANSFAKKPTMDLAMREEEALNYTNHEFRLQKLKPHTSWLGIDELPNKSKKILLDSICLDDKSDNYAGLIIGEEAEIKDSNSPISYDDMTSKEREIFSSVCADSILLNKYNDNTNDASTGSLNRNLQGKENINDNYSNKIPKDNSYELSRRNGNNLTYSPPSHNRRILNYIKSDNGAKTKFLNICRNNNFDFSKNKCNMLKLDKLTNNKNFNIASTYNNGKKVVANTLDEVNNLLKDGRQNNGITDTNHASFSSNTKKYFHCIFLFVQIIVDFMKFLKNWNAHASKIRPMKCYSYAHESKASSLCFEISWIYNCLLKNSHQCCKWIYTLCLCLLLKYFWLVLALIILLVLISSKIVDRLNLWKFNFEEQDIF